MPEELPEILTLRIPTDLAWVRPTRKMLEGLLAAQAWPEESMEDAGLVLTEIVQNAIEHGSRGAGDERVDIHCRVTPRGLELEVSDPGTGKDPAVVLRRDVTLPVPPDATRGRGLYLVHRLTVCFERRIGTGGGLHIRVQLSPEDA